MTEKEFSKTLKIVKKLRKKCPWDKKQTHKTLERFAIEESYELVDAIRSKNQERIKDELGDLLLEIMLQIVVAEENSEFSLKDVLNVVIDKLVLRHPHVFKDEIINSAEEVEDRWEEFKKNST